MSFHQKTILHLDSSCVTMNTCVLIGTSTTILDLSQLCQATSYKLLSSVKLIQSTTLHSCTFRHMGQMPKTWLMRWLCKACSMRSFFDKITKHRSFKKNDGILQCFLVYFDNSEYIHLNSRLSLQEQPLLALIITAA